MLPPHGAWVTEATSERDHWRGNIISVGELTAGVSVLFMNPGDERVFPDVMIQRRGWGGAGGGVITYFRDDVQNM